MQTYIYKPVIIILVHLISFVAYAQKSIPTKQDMQTYRKLESGGFSNNFYLKAIIEKKVTDSSVLELQRKWQYVDDDVFCEGLIQSLLIKNHGGRYKNSHYFTSLNFEEFNGHSYFYQSTTLYEDKELFIWGKYEDNDSIEIHSAIGDHLEIARYTAAFKTMNHSDYIIFEADEQVAIIPMEGGSAVTLKYDVEALKKTGVYRKCLLTCDTCIKCIRMQYTGVSDQVKIQQRVFTSELLIDDIDKDGIDDLYWFAVSNGKLIKYESYILREEKLILVTKDMKKLISETPRFKEIQQISRLKQIPQL